MSRWRDPEFQVIGNYSDLTKWGSAIFEITLIDVTLSSTCSKAGISFLR